MKILTITIEVYDKTSEWEQTKFLVSGKCDVFGTDDLDSALNFVAENLRD